MQNNKNGKKGGKDGRGKREDKVPATQPDLDKDMDSCKYYTLRH